MGIRTLDNVGVVVADLERAIAFFEALGLRVEGRAEVGGDWVDQVLGMEDVRSSIAVLSTPDGHGRLELMTFHSPRSVDGDTQAPPNTYGLRRLAFTVDDIEASVTALHEQGGELMGDVVRYEDAYRLCYARGPEGLIVMLAEPLG